nr:Uncharacterised protein [Escherichia coli]
MSMESRYLALDYAVSQHILPLLNGYGQGFGKRLEALLNILLRKWKDLVAYLKEASIMEVKISLDMGIIYD